MSFLPCMLNFTSSFSVRQRRISQATEGLKCVCWSFGAVQSLCKQMGIPILASTRNVLKEKIIQTWGNGAMLCSCTT